MLGKPLKGRILLAGAALAAIGAGGSAAALGTGSTSGKSYAGCLTRSGTLTNVHVNPRHPPRCPRGSRRISWNQTGPTGPQGAQGPQGPQGPAGVSPTIAGTVMSDTGINVPPSSAATIRLNCPAGNLSTGGGGGFPNPGGSNLTVQDSEPILTGATPTGWQVIALNGSGSTATADEFTVCLDPVSAQGHIARSGRIVHGVATVRLTPIRR